MNKLLIAVLALVLLLPLVCATGEGTLYQEMIIWSDALTPINYYPNLSANITLWNPAAELIFIDQIMTQANTGLFYYNFTPNMTGIYYTTTTYYNATQTLAFNSDTFYVGDSESMYVALLIGLLALIIGSFWYARTMANKPLTAVGVWIFENVTTRDFSIVFDILGAFLIIPLMALLSIWSQGTPYANIFSSIYTGGVYFVGFAILAYLVFYLIFRFNQGIEDIASNMNTERGKGRDGK